MVKIALMTAASGGAWLLGLGAWTAHEHGAFHGHRRGGADQAMVQRLVDFAVSSHLDEIGATPEQRQKVNAVKERLVKEGRALREGKDGLRDELMTAWAEDQPDPVRVRALVHQRTDALVRFADQATDALLEIHATLTPEQRAQLLDHARARLDRRRRF